MKTSDAKEKKQLKQLSDQELEKVNGGGNTVKIHVAIMCDELTNPCEPGMRKSPINCQCEPMPNTDYR